MDHAPFIKWYRFKVEFLYLELIAVGYGDNRHFFDTVLFIDRKLTLLLYQKTLIPLKVSSYDQFIYF